MERETTDKGGYCVCVVSKGVWHVVGIILYLCLSPTDSGEPKPWGVQRRKGIFTQVIIHDLKVAGGRAHAKGVAGM